MSFSEQEYLLELQRSESEIKRLTELIRTLEFDKQNQAEQANRNILFLNETLSIINNPDQLNIMPENDRPPRIHAAKEMATTLRPFDGQSQNLNLFIVTCDRYYNNFGLTDDPLLTEYVNGIICAKLVDQAAIFLASRPDLFNWPILKLALQEKFCDRTSITVLQQQFQFMSKKPQENIIDFVERIKIAKNQLAARIQSDIIPENQKLALIQLNEKLAVTILTAHAPYDLRIILRAHAPNNIEDASTLTIDHHMTNQQIESIQNATRNSKPRNIYTQFQHQNHYNQNTSRFPQTFKPNHNHQYQNQFQQPSFRQFNNYQRPTFPSQPINLSYRQQQTRQHFPTNEEVFGKPQNAFKPNNNNNNNNNHHQRPTPMSTTSRAPTGTFTNRQNQFHKSKNQFKQTRPMDFTSEELFNTEDKNYNQQQYYDEKPPRDATSGIYQQEPEEEYYHQEEPDMQYNKPPNYDEYNNISNDQNFQLDPSQTDSP